MTPKVKEILRKSNFESKTSRHTYTKKELLIKLGAQESKTLVKDKSTKSGSYYNDAYYDENVFTGFIGSTAYSTAEITNEEYNELLPYVALVECTKTSKWFNATLRAGMIILWIIYVVSLILFILFVHMEAKIKWWIAIGSFAQLCFMQTFANAIFENAKNNEKISESILSLGKYLLKKNTTQTKE